MSKFLTVWNNYMENSFDSVVEVYNKINPFEPLTIGGAEFIGMKELINGKALWMWNCDLMISDEYATTIWQSMLTSSIVDIVADYRLLQLDNDLRKDGVGKMLSDTYFNPVDEGDLVIGGRISDYNRQKEIKGYTPKFRELESINNFIKNVSKTVQLVYNV